VISLSDRIQQRQTLLSTSRFQVDRVEYRLSSGQKASREVIQHPGAVVIIPVLEDGRICLIQNYRVAVDQQILELPAGTLEPYEPPLQTAYRELIEETGYRAGKMRPLLQLLMSPGILNERMHVFLAQDLTPGDTDLQAGEEIQNFLVSPEQAQKLLRDNVIQDSKTVSALLYYLQFSV
jgi:ADP-ribose pyrophosphatase